MRLEFDIIILYFSIDVMKFEWLMMRFRIGPNRRCKHFGFYLNSRLKSGSRWWWIR